MTDYKEMTYFALKEECKKKKLDTKGEKEQLIERLEGKENMTEEKTTDETLTQEETKTEEVVTEEVKQPELPLEEVKAKPPVEDPIHITIPSQAELEKFAPDAIFLPVEDARDFTAWTNENRLSKLENQLKATMAGKASFKINTETRQVEFMGGLRGLQSTTLIDTDKQICNQARIYVSRAFKGGNNFTSTI